MSDFISEIKDLVDQERRVILKQLIHNAITELITANGLDIPLRFGKEDIEEYQKQLRDKGYVFYKVVFVDPDYNALVVLLKDGEPIDNRGIVLKPLSAFASELTIDKIDFSDELREEIVKNAAEARFFHHLEEQMKEGR